MSISLRISLPVLLCVLLFSYPALAQFTPQQTAGGQLRQEEDIERDRAMNDRFRYKRALSEQPMNATEGAAANGMYGNVTFEGAPNFGPLMLKSKVGLRGKTQASESQLRKALSYINDSPDRTASASAEAGKTVITVNDRSPFHAGAAYDNFASKIVNRDRYTLFLENNSLIGYDDKLLLRYRRGDDSRLILEEGSYSFPLSSTFEFGGYALKEKTRLRGFDQFGARGRSDVFGFFTREVMYQNGWADIRWDNAFDYKKIRDFRFGEQTARDALRIFRTGLDADLLDPIGRNILVPEVQFGIPDIFGGMEAKDDPQASRSGAGGRFTKGVLTYYRLQPLPFDLSVLWKNYGQYTNNRLVTSEQFQIGGPVSVRGYPAAEFAGDNGYYTSPELFVPLYFIPREVDIPFSRVSLYDSTRLMLFYDWATTSANGEPIAGSKKQETIMGWGYGLRFAVKDNLTLKVEVGYPLGKDPSDHTGPHPWVEVIGRF